MANQNSKQISRHVPAAAKKRTVAAKKNRRLSAFGAGILAVLVLSLIIFEVYNLNLNPIRTVTALEETVLDSVDATAFMLRDEMRLNVDLSGYTVPFVQDGERVAANAEIAARFTDDGSAARYAELLELQSTYDRYLALSSGTEYSSMKVESLMNKAQQGVCAYLQAVEAGKIAQAEQYENDFLDKETALEIAVSGGLDLSGKLAEISKMIAAQNASVSSYETVSTGCDCAGYFLSETDGFEDTLSYADVSKLTVARLERALQAEPTQSEGGKLVRSHVWYIAAVVDARDAESIASVKGKIRVRFPEVGVGDVRAEYYAAHADARGKSTVILRCIEVNEQVLSLRKAKVQILRGEMKGFKIPSSAVRTVKTEDGQQIQGVYILRGNVVSLRKIDTIYSGEDYILSASDAESGYVKLYDEIITGGKDLHDGAIVYQ